MNLHMILRSVYPEAIPYYNADHIVTKIDGKFYDIRGVVTDAKRYQPLTDYYDKKHLSRCYTQLMQN